MSNCSCICHRCLLGRCSYCQSNNCNEGYIPPGKTTIEEIHDQLDKKVELEEFCNFIDRMDNVIGVMQDQIAKLESIINK